MPFETHVLIELVGDAEQIAVRRRRRAERQPRDLLRGVEIALGEERRQLQHAGDVVEAVADLVGRQPGGGIDFERQQIADRVLVLGAIQSMKRLGAARVRVGGRRRDRGRLRATRRSRRSPAAAGRGMPAGGIRPARSLTTTFSHSAPCAPTFVDVQRVEGQATGLQPLVVAGDAVGVDERLARAGTAGCAPAAAPGLEPPAAAPELLGRRLGGGLRQHAPHTQRRDDPT